MAGQHLGLTWTRMSMALAWKLAFSSGAWEGYGRLEYSQHQLTFGFASTWAGGSRRSSCVWPPKHVQRVYFSFQSFFLFFLVFCSSNQASAWAELASPSASLVASSTRHSVLRILTALVGSFHIGASSWGLCKSSWSPKGARSQSCSWSCSGRKGAEDPNSNSPALIFTPERAKAKAKAKFKMKAKAKPKAQAAEDEESSVSFSLLSNLFLENCSLTATNCQEESYSDEDDWENDHCKEIRINVFLYIDIILEMCWYV